MTSRGSDASLERRTFLSASSPHSEDAPPPSDVQTRARKSPAASPLHWLAGLIAVVGLVVVASLLHATENSQSLRDDQDVLEARDAFNIPRRLARFEVNQSVLDNLDTVEVAFEYKAPQPAFYARDRVAAYCVSAADERANRTPSLHEFMDEVSTDGKGSGVVQIGPLVNMRCSWLLRFITRVDEDDKVLGESELLRFKRGPTQPLQVHLALTEKADEMRVKWVSDNVSTPVVVFGEEREKLERVERATQSSYQADDMCHGPATAVAPRNYRDPGQIFDAVMTKLEAGKRYFYQVGDEKGEKSVVLEFRMPPAVGNNRLAEDVEGSSMSFFVYGDLNTPVGATDNFAEDNGNCGTTMQLIREDMERAAADPSKHRYVAVMHVGDLAYAMGSTYIWDQFGHLIEYAAARLPYMISMGNHDYGFLEGVKKDPVKWPSHPTFEKHGTHGHDSYGECGVPSEKRFHMPDNGNGVYWYSFDTGLAHHAVVSSEHEFTRGSPLHKWLMDDLKSVDRSKTPWVFVYIHRPLYCSVAYSGDYYRSLMFRDELEQELADHHVDIVFAGHYHSYERTCPVFGDRCIESPSGKAMAPVHLMVGSGGYKVDDAGFYRSRWREQGFLEHGYGRVHIYNSTHLHFEFVSDVERRVKDDAWIVSTHDWPSNRERYPPGYFPAQDIAGFGAAVMLALLASYASGANFTIFKMASKWKKLQQEDLDPNVLPHNFTLRVLRHHPDVRAKK
ncbi:hypothetical protein PF005_g14308 [Phytophthora fragariae]|uniref:Purple acid phosphatase n=1 Tax=Phytophthora fragariae TaxID=53985 RepID=A0A6A3RRZ7_9STRA|nr:hypothetical protein PF011_g13111 [Phytophthora fragariae]KAE9086600.1 hypothetical protein PF010_g20022 [Phytophthora fragariae]KAE9102798.1 hypothetical protein PF007_g14627 [Phytophthora fragariae]KAE9128920.1 hypothetical protein PF006_g16161 [Phytophthora fragariae]KAE9203139.1 hypothetical protein PF005_g14308 [Phytophthora fragariae]